MATVVKQVHQRAGKQEKERQDPEKMRAMLGEQKESRDGQEADQHPVAPLIPPVGIVLMCIVRHGSPRLKASPD
jgi:hypothetical protein